jgi:fructokinase
MAKLFRDTNIREMGHIYLPKHKKYSYEGFCDYYSACLEGLVAGSSIKKCYRIKVENLSADHEVLKNETHYLAHAALSYTMLPRPDCIIFSEIYIRNTSLNYSEKNFKSILSSL